MSFSVEIRNTSGVGCTLDGYPTISYLDAAGKPAATGRNAPVSGTDRGLVELQPVLGQVCSVTDVEAIQAGPSPPADN